MLDSKAALSVLIILVASPLAIAFSGTPPDGRTGAPGESTCAGCHGNLNVGTGSVTLNAPSSYAPGETILLNLVVEQVGQQRWGFEITVLDDLDQPVGTLNVVDVVRTQKSTAGSGREYLKQTSGGTDPGTPNTSPGWDFSWTAPAGPLQAVTFYFVGNAADNNGSVSGDFIYTDSFSYDDTSVAPEGAETTWGMIKSLYR